MGYLQEIDALQRFIYKAATLKSIRLTAAPPTVARPIILWENPSRGRNKNLTRYTYVVRVQQFGKLFVSSYDEAAIFQDYLLSYLEEAYGVLPVYESESSVVEIAKLKNVTIEFSNSENLDIPFTLTYEATYTRRRPEVAPPAVYVGTRLTMKEKRGPSNG